MAGQVAEGLGHGESSDGIDVTVRGEAIGELNEEAKEGEGLVD